MSKTPPKLDVTDRLPSRISPSRAKEYVQCPRLFYYKTILKMPTPGSIAMMRGTLAHAAFEMIFDFPRGERTKENAVPYVRAAWDATINPFKPQSEVVEDSAEWKMRLNMKAFGEEYTENSAKKERALANVASAKALLQEDGSEEELLTSAEVMVENWFNIENPNRFEPVGREVHLQAKALNITLHGFIDRLDRIEMPNGEVRWYISDYKSLPLNTYIPTPSGWTTMGDVQVGDYIMAPSGKAVRVEGKSEVKLLPLTEFAFDDGTTISSDGEHRWEVVRDGKVEILNTTRVAEDFTAGSSIHIKNTLPLDLPDVDAATDFFATGQRIASGYVRVEDEAFLTRTGTSQRQMLLDGILSRAGSTGTRIPTHALTLVEDLVVGLGGLFSVIEDGEDFTIISVKLGEGLVRKLVSVRSVKSVPSQCLMVADESHLFLAGKSMLPTHNTGKVPAPRFLDDAFFAMKVYAVLLKEQYGEDAYELRLIHVKNGNKEDTRTLRVTPAMIRSTKAKMEMLWKEIEKKASTNAWNTQTGPLCSWCHFQPICPAFNKSIGLIPEEENLIKTHPDKLF